MGKGITLGKRAVSRCGHLWRIVALLGAFAVLSPMTYAQGSRVDTVAQRTVQGLIAPIPGAQITVCTAAGTGTPCTPIATIYSDQGLTQPITGSVVLADSNGNAGFWAPPGTYKYSITATGVIGQLYTIVLPDNPSANTTFTGSKTFTQQIVSTVSTGTAPLSIASTTVVPNLNTQLHGGLTAPSSAIVGISDTQTLTNKTITTPTINGLSVAQPVAQIFTGNSTATNFGVALSTQTIVASVPSNGTFAIFFSVTQSLSGVGCSAVSNSVTPTISFTAPGGTAETFSPSVLNMTGNGVLDQGTNLTSSTTANPYVAVAKAGTSITYTTTSTLSSTGCTTIPQYTIFVKAFF